MAEEARDLIKHLEAERAHSATCAEGMILIVDDEDSITRALQGALSDEGYECLVAHNGQTALELLQRRTPSLVLLDIWMPDMDGLETLRQIRTRFPSIPVVMISGHATIATAMKASQMGASGFIEKPLDLEATLLAVRRIILPQVETLEGGEELEGTTKREPRVFTLGDQAQRHYSNPASFRDTRLSGRTIKQRTLSHNAILYGQGLHSGKKSGLILEPLPENSGIHFAGINEGISVPGHVDFVESTGFATTLQSEGIRFRTIEHLMSALHAYRIANVLIKCNAEVPVMDGSAQEFCALFDEVGIVEQDGNWREIVVDTVLEVGEGNEYIKIEPAEEFSVTYLLDYPAPVGRQEFTFVLDSVESYKAVIAPARTFGFVRDIGALQKQGLALGGRFDNFVLMGDKGPINAELRFPDELVRHKILDVIGDLFLLGRPICGKVTARMTGHSDNVELLRKLKRRLD